MKKMNMKELKMKSKPWVSGYLAKLIEHRNKLFKKKKKEQSNENVRMLYNKFRNRVNREIKKLRKEYFNQYFEDNKTNIKKTCTGITNIINTKAIITPKTSQLLVNGKIIDDPVGIANCHNDFFVNVGQNIDKAIPVNNKSPDSFLKSRNNFNFLITFVTNEELIDIIKSLDCNKSSVSSSIPTKLLLLIPDLIVFP